MRRIGPAVLVLAALGCASAGRVEPRLGDGGTADSAAPQDAAEAPRDAPSALDAGSDACAPITYYPDVDGDGHGATEGGAPACSPPPGRVATTGDCDDARAAAHPGAPETCNGRDDDCDGAIDGAMACPVGCVGAVRESRDYLFCASARTWADAATACISLGMRLVRIDDAAEGAWVRAQATSASLDSPWLGGSDAATEGRWVWADGTQFWMGRADGSPVGGLYAAWASGEPNDDDGEDCLELRPPGDWNDGECGAADSWICER